MAGKSNKVTFGFVCSQELAETIIVNANALGVGVSEYIRLTLAKTLGTDLSAEAITRKRNNSDLTPEEKKRKRAEDAKKERDEIRLIREERRKAEKVEAIEAFRNSLEKGKN